MSDNQSLQTETLSCRLSFSLDGIVDGGTMIQSFKVLIPVEETQFAETVRFYSEVFDVPDHEIGESDLGNPWCSLNLAGTTVMIY